MAVVWDNNDHTREWYIALYIDNNYDGTMRVHHLERYTENWDNEWKRLPNDDIQDIRAEQIVLCVVEGIWDNTDDNKKKFEKLF